MKFRRLFTAGLFTLTAVAAMAQYPLLTNYDAYTFGHEELNGTARFVGVGGAMGALGGDATTIFYNPAGIGIYRSSEITASLNINWTNTTMSNDAYKSPQERWTTANFANAAYVGHWDIGANRNKQNGLLGISMGVAYNRIKSYDRIGSYSREKSYSKTQYLASDATGQNYEYLNVDNWNNESVGYRAITGYETFMFDVKDAAAFTYTSFFDENYPAGSTVKDNVSFSEYGSTNEFALSLAGNISNIFYLGMSFACDYTSYRRSDNYTEYMPDGKSLNTTSSFDLVGTGFTYKVGFILSPTNWLRIGGAYHTPAYYYATSTNYGSASSNLNGKFGSVSTPISSERALINAPMKAIASLGFILGKFGFIGIDYQWTNETGAFMKATNGFKHTTINDITKSEMADTHTFRIGFEVKPFDALSLRLGGVYRTAAFKPEASRYYYITDTRTDTHYVNDNGAYSVSAGVGYRIGRHAFDLAYIWQVNNGLYYEFNSPGIEVAPLNIRSVRNQFIVSYSIRF